MRREDGASVVLGFKGTHLAGERDLVASERRGLEVAIVVHHDSERWRLQIDVPAEVEAALRAALVAGGGKIVVRVDDVDKVSLLNPAPAREEHLEMQRRVARLSRAERNVLDLLAEGLTNRQIADRLFLAPKTVKNYMSSLLCKLDMSRRTEAAVFAARLRDESWPDTHAGAVCTVMPSGREMTSPSANTAG